MRKNKDDRYYAELLLRETNKLLSFASRVDFRNLLVHEYGKPDYSAYRDLIETDVPKLKASLETFLSR